MSYLATQLSEYKGGELMKFGFQLCSSEYLRIRGGD